MLILFTAQSCAPPVEIPTTPSDALIRLEPAQYPDFIGGGGADSLGTAVSNSIDYLKKLPEDDTLLYGRDRYTVREMKKSLYGFRAFLKREPSPDEIAEYVGENFTVYISAGSDGLGTAMFTGYFTPMLKASRTKTGKYLHPVYRTPADMVIAELGEFKEPLKGERITGRVSGRKLSPYHTRDAIDYGGVLDGLGCEIAWCEDEIEVFFLHVQGSGMLGFEDGSTINLNYDSQNGRAYSSIGRLIIDEGKASLDEMSLDWLRDYLRKNPDEVRRVLGHNESYVFFSEDVRGPYGCYGVPVVEERSIATDKAFFPACALCFIQTEVPAFKGDKLTAWDGYSRFVMNHDTGGAIKKAGRVDIYFGHGSLAEKRAGYMKRFGVLYVLAPKSGA
jgi:membrane-bound lytic murein transglycosylase A